MNPNPENYGSLEACQRLYDAGIVVETEAGWYKIFRPGSYAFDMVLSMRSGNEKFYGDNYPAPSMAEAWRELPERIIHKDRFYFPYLICLDCIVAGYCDSDKKALKNLISLNPTDALIYLLIWVRKDRP